MVEWINRLPLRRLTGYIFGGLAAGYVLVAGLGYWFAQPPAVIAGLGLLLIGMAWMGFDFLLRRRLHDRKSFPARPEFYDFGLLNQPMHLGELAGRRLKELEFVVFDTETTGLKPSGGDEIVSIAGVRIRDGIMETGNAFSRLVNPGFSIPKSSIRFHGITDQMVEGEDAISQVLPLFHEFVGDAILIAHNAAFDMKFLKLKEQASGVVFDQIVLDSLLLSVFLDHDSHNHTLDAIAERLGVTVEGRHTALGDALVTAAVFQRMLDRLEARGITTVRQAIDASNGVAHIRRMQEQF
ncbi:MAG: hypothetical protein HQ483_13535 [Rhodospirillales bacterium]|nr:hypothetical protein [Rhodospirillales bacterium]